VKKPLILTGYKFSNSY